jgi:uncharacterized protein (DUF885 family)
MLLTAVLRTSALLVVGALAGYGPPPDNAAHMASEFVYETLAFSPVAATQAGYHTHNGRPLDEMLDDLSESAMNRRRDFYQRFRTRLESVSRSQASAQDLADLDIMRTQTELALLELNTIQDFRHNPTIYVELIGNALYIPYTLEYAPKPARFQHIIARMRKMSDFLTQARANLESAPAAWIRVAVEENEGNKALIDQTLRGECPAELKEAYDAAAKPAIDELNAFNGYLQTNLSRRPADWRLGPEKYAQKFRCALGTNRSPADVLKEAESQLNAVRELMAQIAGTEGVQRALDRFAKKHATPETYFDEAKADLAEATAFVRDHHFVPLPAAGNLQVIPTPEFMRGIYGVGGFSPAPPLEPKLGAYYWITPVPKNWPSERIESKLREYNFYGLKILTVHEAMPGHWLQAEYAARLNPEERRVLRAVYGSVPYIEGWAVYATDYMIADGYYKNDPGMQLNWYKQLLRVISNTILDIRLQTMNMTEQEAIDLMIRDTYQEKEEATAKYQRAQLSSCQLPAYFIGWSDWRRLREDAQRSGGAGWNESQFHEAALDPGAIGMDSLRALILKK